MNADVRRLFHELADLSPDERQRILRERPLDTDLRAEVESLLSFDSPDAPPLAECVSQAADDMLRSAVGRESAVCGPYRLARLLGSGGMGSVYLADRTDGELQQQVAVKLLRADSSRPSWQDRFLRERQLLASLQHPSIVRVLDAGHTGDGRPYLVMEYVEGSPIDVAAAAIDLRERLALFLRVCDGVTHAHRHLIIHRDLKPSNILVDSAGQPKLLDFGIAKLLDDAGETTQTVERLLTPNYASPEQLAGAVQTTATDVYSLGAVLYKMLAGRSPHESDTGASQALEVVAGIRQIPAVSRVNPKLPADLDYILRKALRKEPEERYASVEALAADVHACLESRPVQARSGDAWYRTRKFLRRYWVPVAAGALVIVSLSTGLFVANRARATAERRFQQLRQLSNNVFDLDQAIRNLPGSMQARQRLVSVSLKYLEGLAADSRGDLGLAQELADGYWSVARVQGVPAVLNLGEFSNAEVNLKKADALADTVLASRPQDRRALIRSAYIAHDRMIVAQSERRNAEALAHAGKAALRLESLMHLPEVSKDDRTDASLIYGNIALAQVNLHRYADAIADARRAVELSRTVPSGDYLLAKALSLLANALRYQGDLDGALQSIQEARKVADRTVYRTTTLRMFNLYGILLREGQILGEDGGINLDRPADAIEPLQKAFALTEEAARQDPRDSASRSRVGTVGRDLGDILRHSDPQGALAAYDLALRRLGEIPNNLKARRDQALALADSSYALRALHRNAEAKQRIDRALAILKDTKDYPAQRIPLDSEVFTAVCALADYEDSAGDPRHAVELDRQLLDGVMAAKPDPLSDLRDAPKMSRLYQTLAGLYRRTGNTAGAGDMASRRLELWHEWDGKLPNNPFVSRQLAAARLP